MNIILSSQRHHCVARFSIFLVMVASIVGMAGCGGVEYDFTIDSTAGGAVTTPSEGTFTYDEGEVVNLVAEAEEGCSFVNWTGDVSTIADVNDATTTITMNGDYDITANFEEAVTFADPNLESAVRQAIGIPERPIYPSDLKGLTLLYAPERNIADLTGLAQCPNLTDLYLKNNQISDISPLVDNEGLSEGDTVSLEENPLSSDSINIYIPQLQARGVIVDY